MASAKTNPMTARAMTPHEHVAAVGYARADGPATEDRSTILGIVSDTEGILEECNATAARLLEAIDPSPGIDKASNGPPSIRGLLNDACSVRGAATCLRDKLARLQLQLIGG